MKKNIFKFLGLAICAMLLSFTRIGGESFTIHLNDKLIIDHYFTSKAQTPSFSIDQASMNAQLSVYYNECGKIGTQRKLSIRDEKDQTLKEWTFTNSSDGHDPMVIKVKDVVALKQKGSNALRLYYRSDRVSGGKYLAKVNLSDELRAAR